MVLDTCSVIAPDVPFAKIIYLEALVVVSSVTLIKLAILAVKALAVPEALVSTTADGVPRLGVTNVGLFPKDVKLDAVTPDAKVAPDRVPAAAVTVISADPLNATPLILREVVKVAALPVVFWFNVGKVQLVNVPEDGVPNTGVTKVGEVANTNAPVPVSSEITPSN